MTKTGVVRPWSDVAWDLARAAGVDHEAVADELDRLTDDDWDREAALLEQLNTVLATKLWQDLLSGAKSLDGLTRAAYAWGCLQARVSEGERCSKRHPRFAACKWQKPAGSCRWHP